MKTAVRFAALLAGLLGGIAVGICALAYGAVDDSPGLQALGGLLIVAMVLVALRTPPESIGLRRRYGPAAVNR